jgi:hypothetical protein
VVVEQRLEVGHHLGDQLRNMRPARHDRTRRTTHVHLSPQ